MRRTRTNLLSVAFFAVVLASAAYAQRGTGATTGVAQQVERPELVLLSGSVLEIETGPCEATTGRSRSGTHVLLETATGKPLNIHLGPATVVESIVDRLEIGQKIKVRAFRTERMLENHYAAQVLILHDTPIRLRDEMLRPTWVNNSDQEAGFGNSRWSSQRTQGPGKGRRGGYGRGRGRGAGYGRGQGAGYGRYRNFVDENRDGICDRYASLGGKPGR